MWGRRVGMGVGVMLIQQRSQWSASAVHVMSEALVFSIAQCLVVALDGFMWFPGEG